MLGFSSTNFLLGLLDALYLQVHPFDRILLGCREVQDCLSLLFHPGDEQESFELNEFTTQLSTETSNGF